MAERNGKRDPKVVDTLVDMAKDAIKTMPELDSEQPKKGKVLNKVKSPRQLQKLQRLYYTAAGKAEVAELAAQVAGAAGAAYKEYESEVKDALGIPEAMPVIIEFITGEVRVNEEEVLRQVKEERAKKLEGLSIMGGSG